MHNCFLLHFIKDYNLKIIKKTLPNQYQNEDAMKKFVRHSVTSQNTAVDLTTHTLSTNNTEKLFGEKDTLQAINQCLLWGWINGGWLQSQVSIYIVEEEKNKKKAVTSSADKP